MASWISDWDFVLTLGVLLTAPHDRGALPGRPAESPWAQPTHRLLVSARLAGVLEAGKLAVAAGPAVLINDALLGGMRGSQ